MRDSIEKIIYQVAATLDIFKGQLSLTDVLSMELPLLSELYVGRAKFLEEKNKIEQKELEKARQNAANRKKKK